MKTLKITYKKALIFVAAALIVFCGAIGLLGNRPAYQAYAASSNEPTQGVELHGYEIDNWVPFMAYLEGLGYDLSGYYSFDFVQDYMQEYYDALELGILVPLENDILFSWLQFQPFWSSDKDYEKYKTTDTHHVVANKAYEAVQPIYSQLFGTIPSNAAHNTSNGSGTDWANLVWYSAWPDKNEDEATNATHFYYPENGGNLYENGADFIYGLDGLSAKDRFEGHYNDAVNFFKGTGGKTQSKTEALRSLGKALHYMGDLATPVHTGYQVNNIIDAGWYGLWEHAPFENSAKDVQGTAFNAVGSFPVHTVSSNLWTGSLSNFVDSIAWASNALYPSAKSNDKTTRENTARTSLRNAADACASVMKRFAEDVKYKTVNISDNNIKIIDTGYNLIGSVEIPAEINGRTVTQIGNYAFDYQSQMSQISIPASVTSIGEEAFYLCNSLTSVNFGQNSQLNSIGKSAFGYCGALEQITLPNNLTGIGDKAFDHCASLININIPSNVTSISDYAFFNCGDLESITFSPNSKLVDIGVDAFGRCSSLESINIPQGVKSLQFNAFASCSSMTTITIPSSITSIDDDVFWNCPSLSEVFYGGANSAAWDNINIGSYNTALTNATRYYYSAIQPTTSGKYWRYVNNIPTPWPVVNWTGLTANGSNGTTTTTQLTLTFSQNPTFAFTVNNITVTGATKGTLSGTGLIRTLTISNITVGNGGTVSVALTNPSGILFSGSPKTVTVYVAPSGFAGGNGSQSNPYQISTAGQLMYLASQVNAVSNWSTGLYFVLTGDIILNDTTNWQNWGTTAPANVWTPIGTTSNPFKGNFSGNGFIVKGIYINNSSSYLGLFGAVNAGIINNLGIEQSYIKGLTIVGGIVGRLENNSLVTNSFNKGTISSTTNGAGGIAGRVVSSKIVNCFNTGTITSNQDVGGIVGWAQSNSVIVNNYNLGEVSYITSTSYIGGIAGDCNNDCRLEFNYFLKTSTINSNINFVSTVRTPIGIANNRTFNTSGTLRNEANTVAQTITIGGTARTILLDALNAAVDTAGIMPVPPSGVSYLHWSGTSYPVLSLSIPGTTGLKYTLINSGTAYEVSKGTADTNEEIVIPSSHNGKPVIKIARDAFRNCNLTSVTIPGSVTSIGDWAFWNCNNFASLTIPGSVSSFGRYAFGSCDMLSSVTLMDGVTNIGDNAFYSCNELMNVEIPSSVTSIGTYAFYYCQKLENVNFGSNSQLDSIGSDAFESCSSLTGITIPESVTKIESYAFSSSGLTSFTIPRYVSNIGTAVFYRCNGLESLSVDSGNTVYMSEGDCIIRRSDYALILGCKDSEIPNYVTNIGPSAFAGLSVLTNITIPDSIRSIGNNAFSWCSGLTSITIPNGVESIESSAFARCSGLTSITIPASVTSIGNSAFSYCSSLAGISVDSGNTVFKGEGECIIRISDNTLIFGCKGSIIPTSVTSIGSYAFQGSGLTSIVIPYNVTSIGSRAFASCSSLTSITLGSGLSNIADWVFYNSGLTSINIPSNVRTIGYNAFYYCTSLTSVTFAPDSQLETIGDSAFSSCHNLYEITIPASVTYIGYSAFSSCGSLTVVNLGDGIQLEYIGDSAFSDCYNLLEITIPASVTYVGGYAFQNWYEYQTIYIEDINQVNQWEHDWNADCYAQIVCDHSLAGTPGLEYNFIYDDYGNPGYEVSVGDSIYNGYTFIVIPEFYDGIPVIKVADYGFYDCYEMTGIIIPSNIKRIGEYAFYDCHNLMSVIFSGVSQLESINAYTFYNCHSLISINIPGSVIAIQDSAFAYCYSLISITMPETVEYIEANAFEGCYEITIYTEAAPYPSDWHFLWYEHNYSIIWECTLSPGKDYVVSIVTSPENVYYYTYVVSAPHRDGYIFGGWTTIEGSDYPEYMAEDIMWLPDDMILYAIWIPA